MRPLGEFLAQRGIRARGLRLPGHGVSPRALDQVTSRDWEEASEEGLSQLHGHSTVFVAGLSMGALLALLLAARHPSRVHGLVLLAPAIALQNRRLRLLRTLHVTPLFSLLRPWLTKKSTDLQDPAALAAAPILAAFPSARLVDLTLLQETALRESRQVRAPSLVVTAKEDHVVTSTGVRKLVKRLRRSSHVEELHLDAGSHIMPRDFGQSRLFEEVGRFFDRLRAPAQRNM